MNYQNMDIYGANATNDDSDKLMTWADVDRGIADYERECAIQKKCRERHSYVRIPDAEKIGNEYQTDAASTHDDSGGVAEDLPTGHVNFIKDTDIHGVHSGRGGRMITTETDIVDHSATNSNLLSTSSSNMQDEDVSSKYSRKRTGTTLVHRDAKRVSGLSVPKNAEVVDLDSETDDPLDCDDILFVGC